MTTESKVAPALQTAEYILSRLTSWFGNRTDHFSGFMDGNVRADGWLPAEAYFALSGPVSRKAINVTMVRGKAQGGEKFDPDIEIDIDHEFHQLAVVPVLTTADEPLSTQIEGRLAETFEWLNGPLKPRAMIYLLAFPNGLEDDEWKAGLAKAEEKYEAKTIGQMEFVIPRPPRVMLRGAAALFLHASRVPAAE